MVVIWIFVRDGGRELGTPIHACGQQVVMQTARNSNSSGAKTTTETLAKGEEAALKPFSPHDTNIR